MATTFTNCPQQLAPFSSSWKGRKSGENTVFLTCLTNIYFCRGKYPVLFEGTPSIYLHDETSSKVTSALRMELFAMHSQNRPHQRGCHALWLIEFASQTRTKYSLYWYYGLKMGLYSPKDSNMSVYCPQSLGYTLLVHIWFVIGTIQM